MDMYNTWKKSLCSCADIVNLTIMHEAIILNHWCIQLSYLTRPSMAAIIIILCSTDQPCTTIIIQLHVLSRHASSATIPRKG